MDERNKLLERVKKSVRVAGHDYVDDDKVKIDYTQQNKKCWLCRDRDETINHMISECSKLAQKEY